MSEKFCLKWNDFHSNVSKSFGLFRNEEYLHDVTLVSDDHTKVPAHKLVLSACSEYFKDIFKNNHQSHPLLCLDGIAKDDLMNILDYIYNGEVQIYQDNIDRFFALAKRFKLEGLLQDNDHDFNLPVEENFIGTEFVKDEKVISTPFTDYDEKPRKIMKRSQENAVKTVAVTHDFDEQVNQSMEVLSDGSYRCTLCGKTISSRNKKQDMKKHIETHIEGLSYECQICQKTFRSKNALGVHKSLKHK